MLPFNSLCFSNGLRMRQKGGVELSISLNYYAGRLALKSRSEPIFGRCHHHIIIKANFRKFPAAAATAG